MRLLLLFTLLVSQVWAEFYIVSGGERIKLAQMPSGKIDFRALNTLPQLKKYDEKLYLESKDEDLNHRHANTRFATIGLTQYNYTVTEYTEKASETKDIYTTRYDKILPDHVLELFYHNNWYGVVLGDTKAILYALFDDEGLEPKQAYAKVKEARIAYPDDAKLKAYERYWQEKSVLAEEIEKAEEIKQSYQAFIDTKSPSSKRFLAMQTKAQIEDFQTAFSNSELQPAMQELLNEVNAYLHP
jgi:hypothetical protein